VQDEPDGQWVVAEQRPDGTRWPMFVVGSEREAADLVELLRARGGDVIALEIGATNELPA